jgi:hypothetical protein
MISPSIEALDPMRDQLGSLLGEIGDFHLGETALASVDLGERVNRPENAVCASSLPPQFSPTFAGAAD